MEVLGHYEASIERKIRNLEKRMKWIQREMHFLKETARRAGIVNGNPPDRRGKQLDLFAG